MKVRENTVVTLSYYFLSSPDEEGEPETSRMHKIEALIGRDMLPRDIETTIFGMEEGSEAILPIALFQSSSDRQNQDISFFPFTSLPEGIEPRKGLKISVLQGDGSTEVILIEEVLSDGVIGRKINSVDEEPRWIKVRIESVRWATLREFQEGRVISRVGHHHEHFHHAH
jgi:FKBP-type peptidyl-prolyl cis-trans isomerase 2